MSRRVRRILAIALLLALGIAPAALAQGATGAISGTVKDETGAVLPGAAVVVRNTDTSISRELVADAQGRFTAPNLAPGPYELKASLSGFATVVRSGIRLTVGREAVVDFSMKLGEIAESVLVVGESPMVDTRNSSTGGLIAEEQIKGLPLNGRSYIELATLTPGVQLTDTGGRGTSTGFGQKLSVNGSRYTANLFTLDGTMLNDQFNQAGSASGNLLGVEAVREFQVLTNSFSAEYGRHTGAVINAATKSGTNAFHGSVFEFHRNEALDAKNYFDVPGQEPNFSRNQFGFSMGGPIRKDRTFYFATYEGLRERLGTTQRFNVPTESVRRGVVDPRIRPFLESYPLPNGQLFGTTRGEFVTPRARATDEHYLMGRVDHQFSAGQMMFARYTFDDGEVDDPTQRLNTGGLTKTRVQFLTVEHTSIRGASLMNRIQFGYSRSRLDGIDYALDGFNLPRTTFTDVTRGIGAIGVTGLSGWGGETTNPKFHGFFNYQISDNVNLTRGSHNLKFGVHVEFLGFDLTSDFTSMGSFSFESLDDFLANRANTFEAVMPGSDTSRKLRQTVYGFYVQDDIQLRSNLTLNAGVRYEPTSDITETEGRLAQLIEFDSPTATLNDTTVLDAIVKNPTLKTFSPRLGFAWDVGGKGKTSVRGGVGIFYDLLTVNTPIVQNTAVRVPPFINRGGLVRSGTFAIDFPDAYTSQRQALAGQVALEGVQYEPDQSTMYKWNLNIQRELAGRTAIELGYTGTHGVNLFRQIFTNGRVAFVNADGRLQIPTGAPLRQPNFQRMRWRVSDAESMYHGLTVGLTKRAGANFQAQVSYTWSKSIDDGASALGGNDYNTDSGGSRYFYMKDRGLSPFDIRHSFSTNVNYRVPFGRNGGAAAWLVRDWNVGTLLRIRSGYPFSVTTGIDRSGIGPWGTRYPDLAPGANSNPILGGPDRYYDPTAFVLQPRGVIGNLGRNTLIGPGSATIDVQVSRHLGLGGDERTLQLRIEVFNLLNRANFGLPANVLFLDQNGTRREDAGRITNTATAARQMQLGVRVVW
jgi:outer membrane receptor protein involved in Fe transport